METIKATKKHFSELGGMFILGTLIILAVQTLIPMWVFQLRPEWQGNADVNMFLTMAPMYLIGMPLLVVLLKTLPAVQVEKHDMKAGQFAVAAIMCFGTVYITNIIGNIITLIIGALKGGAVQNVIADAISDINMLSIMLYMVLAAPMIEEYVFRKLLVERTLRYGQGVAVLMSGLMFGLFHGNLNQFVYAFALGAFLAYLYVRTGKLKITIALHMMVNFMGGVVSLLVLKKLGLEELSNMSGTDDMAGMMAYFMDNRSGLLLYGVYILFVFGMIIAGGVLLIVFLAKKRFTFEAGEVVLPKGKRFSTFILNPGMIVYCVFWIAMIIMQLFN